MSAVLDLLQTLPPSFAQRDLTQMPLDIAAAKDGYAIWKSLFEQAQEEQAVMQSEKHKPRLALLPGGPAAFDTVSKSGGAIELQRTAATDPINAASPIATAESINVFVQGAAVSIVVRDNTLSEQEAMRCGFETARRLTGQGAALQQLTLNGQTLYRQQDAANAGTAPRALVFAC